MGRSDLRAWVELGVRARRSLGRHRERTRRGSGRADPDRVARHWLVSAVATLWTRATGTRVEDAARSAAGVFARGLARLRWRRLRWRRLRWRRLRWRRLRVRRLWSRIWRRPEPWPAPPGLLVRTSASGVP